ncbi:hypothetical protein HY249_00190 [Candidatus Azambacteria bacterium]|nr:hypothetical protein [Candidatus Azambacteria bacterium]
MNTKTAQLVVVNEENETALAVALKEAGISNFAPVHVQQEIDELPDLEAVSNLHDTAAIDADLQKSRGEEVWAKKAGEELFALYRALSELKKQSFGIENPILSERMDKINDAINKIQATQGQRPHIKKIVRSYQLIAEIKAVENDGQFGAVIKRLSFDKSFGNKPLYDSLSQSEFGRWKAKNDGNLPNGVFRWKGDFYIPQSGNKCQSQLALEAEVCKKAKELSIGEVKEAKSETARILARQDASNDLNALINKGASSGLFKVHLPARKDGKGRTTRDGGAVVFEVGYHVFKNRQKTTVLKPVDFSGIFNFLQEKKGEDWHVTLGAAIFGNISAGYPVEHKEAAVRLVKLTREVFAPIAKKKG